MRAIEIEIAGAKDALATKQDVLGLQHGLEVLKREFDVLRRDFDVLRAEMRSELEKLRVEIHRTVGGVVRQMYLANLGQMAVLLGFAYFFATHLR